MCGKNRKRRSLDIGNTVETSISAYRISRFIGRGGYGKVYECIDQRSGIHYALKVEKFHHSWESSHTLIEIDVVKTIEQLKSKHFCELVDYGLLTPEHVYNSTFMVMTLLGPDLSTLYKIKPFSLSTAVRIGIQSLEAIETLHQAGFLARDIKPHNFAIGTINSRNHRQIFMFDFGLAYRYLDVNGHAINGIDRGGVGTPFYASIRTHMGLKYARRDDLESWFYMLVHLTRGFPFVFPKNVKEKLKKPPTKIEQKIVLSSFLKQKMEARVNRQEFLKNCPKQYDTMLTELDELSVEVVPPYRNFIDILNKCCEENGITSDEKYDWEIHMCLMP